MCIKKNGCTDHPTYARLRATTIGLPTSRGYVWERSQLPQLAVALILAALVYFVWQDTQQNATRRHSEFTQNYSKAEKKISVLIIGNSYIYNNNLPHMLVDIASSISGHNVGLEVRSAMRPGTGLSDIWSEGDAVAVIRSQHWDYVVLQDGSLVSLIPESRTRAFATADKFAIEIARAGAVPIIFETWARQPKSSWYSDPEIPYLKNAEYMHAQIYFHDDAVAKRIKGRVAPIGNVWDKAYETHPELTLYKPDGSHPSIQGSYLAALVLYQTLTGESVEKASYSPTFMRGVYAQTIRALVSSE